LPADKIKKYLIKKRRLKFMNYLFSSKKVNKEKEDVKGYCIACGATCQTVCGGSCTTLCGGNCSGTCGSGCGASCYGTSLYL
jgi:ribosomally synthesized peptide (Cys-rich family)